MPNSIVHFEIPADDLKRAKNSMRKPSDGKSVTLEMDYYMVETKDKGKDGINGGLMLRKMPGQPFMNYISVDSIDQSMKKVEKAGGMVAVPKMEIGNNMGWIAHSRTRR